MGSQCFETKDRPVPRPSVILPQASLSQMHLNTLLLHEAPATWAFSQVLKLPMLLPNSELTHPICSSQELVFDKLIPPLFYASAPTSHSAGQSSTLLKGPILL